MGSLPTRRITAAQLEHARKLINPCFLKEAILECLNKMRVWYKVGNGQGDSWRQLIKL